MLGTKHPICFEKLLILIVSLDPAKHRSNSKGLSPFSTTAGKHLSAILGSHAAPETMCVFSGTIMRLECPFHLYLLSFIRFSMESQIFAKAGCVNHIFYLMTAIFPRLLLDPISIK